MGSFDGAVSDTYFTGAVAQVLDADLPVVFHYGKVGCCHPCFVLKAARPGPRLAPMGPRPLWLVGGDGDGRWQ